MIGTDRFEVREQRIQYLRSVLMPSTPTPGQITQYPFVHQIRRPEVFQTREMGIG
jgi:hypothetical protein